MNARPMLTVPLHVHAAAADLPDVDTDVLIFDSSDDEGQLGALVSLDGGPQWVDAQGQRVEGVTHWADMPRLGLALRVAA